MHQRTGQDVLRDVVRSVVPAELDKVDATCRAYAARPYPPQRLHRSAGDPLGTGIETAVLLPVLVAVVAQVLADLASGRIRAGGARVARWWRRRRQREEAEGRRVALTSAVPGLSEVTRQELTEWALAQSRAAGLSPAEAGECARIIVMAVVRSDAPPPPGGAEPDAPEDPGAAQSPATAPPS
ncbi:hypothetical protein [Streptomyces chromofuscus]|uniref:Uncharacterized protein n=1 Tax=Streptomyces chromofuscus TaxID=42881 RepID=A0A7M2TC12_STRCW|nr:hypothetical protein [Streptomyces chromofuscus]QOV44881.1 hypothetical protein IPT68_02410 [Streptomyces chromofuscus]GGT37108.1 hypothetical protein GCM10010254_66710 [Streptomyces chromofuscus]